MLEGILKQRDEDERCYGGGVIIGNLDVGLDLHAVGDTDAHQFDVTLYKLHLLTEGSVLVTIVIQHMAQQFAQFLH